MPPLVRDRVEEGNQVSDRRDLTLSGLGVICHLCLPGLVQWYAAICPYKLIRDHCSNIRNFGWLLNPAVIKI